MSETENREFNFVLGPRQIAIGLFLAVVLMGTFAAMAYVVGRAMLPIRAAALDDPVPEKVLVVDAAAPAKPTTAPEENGHAQKANGHGNGTNGAGALKVPAPATQTSYFKQPMKGELFLQVAAADRGVAAVFAEYLTRKNLPCQIADGPDDRNHRVLVGPIENNQQLTALRASLEESGFKPFLRRYTD